MSLIDDLNNQADESFYGDGHEDVEQSGGVNEPEAFDFDFHEAKDEEEEMELAFEFDGVLNEPLIEQLKMLVTVAGASKMVWNEVEAFIAEGAPLDAASFDLLQVTVRESQAITLGLNLVGFFAPAMGETAAAVAKRMRVASGLIEPDEETQAKIAEVSSILRERKLAKMLGYEDVDQLKEDMQNPDKFFLAGDDPEIIGMVPPVEDDPEPDA